MSKDIVELLQMLQYRRPDNSPTELEFIDVYIKPVAPDRDAYGNYFVRIGDKPRVLWSCHTDTVHKGFGKQTPTYDPVEKVIRLHPSVPSSCLGADCGGGIFVMLQMIAAGVPGLYVFHRNEESGCGGSRYIAKTHRDDEHRQPGSGFLHGIDAAVAFDRKGRDSVITQMFCGRTCSDAFAHSVIEQIEGYRIDTGGSSTDTGCYREIVPECSNLSIGYENAHDSRETLHVPTLLKLRDAMVAFDVDKLVIARDPKQVPFVRDRYSYPGWSHPYPATTGIPTSPEPDIVVGGRSRKRTKYDITAGRERTVHAMCIEKPYQISRLLTFWNLNYEDLVNALTMMDEAARKDVDPAFKRDSEPTVERVFGPQRPSDGPAPDDAADADDGPEALFSASRGLHALTEDEWIAHEESRRAAYEPFDPDAAPSKPH